MKWPSLTTSADKGSIRQVRDTPFQYVWAQPVVEIFVFTSELVIFSLNGKYFSYTILGLHYRKAFCFARKEVAQGKQDTVNNPSSFAT